jgi:prepilin-type N-terminal cleavage/methylation domain-containing protein
MKKIFQPKRKQSGFTLVETVIAMAVLSFGVLSLSAIYTQGLRASAQTQIQFIAQQKAQEALETLFTARDTKLLTWAQIANVSQGGVFKDGPQALLAAGPDGLIGTADDDAANPNTIVIGPGADNVLGTSDDVTINLNPWMTRTIAITPDAKIPNLNHVTITINYAFEGQAGQFVLNSYLSAFS